MSPWIGCGNNYTLSKGISEKIRQQGITHLADPIVPGRCTFWKHGWKEARDVGIESQEANQLLYPQQLPL